MYILVYMQVTQKTKDWGNSKAVRLPKKVLQAARWKQDQELAIGVKGRLIVLTPIDMHKTDKKLPTLEALLEGVTPEKVQGEIDWGVDRGKEIIGS